MPYTKNHFTLLILMWQLSVFGTGDNENEEERAACRMKLAQYDDWSHFAVVSKLTVFCVSKYQKRTIL